MDGKRQLIEINYQESDWPNGFMNHYENLKNTMLEHGFVVCAFDSTNKLIGFASIIPHNKASLRVVEKLGFHNEGLARKYLNINGKWEDHVHMVLINDGV